MPTNDNEYAAAVPDAHGQAALLLVESLIYGLRERSMLSIAESVEIAETALEVQAEICKESTAPPGKGIGSYTLLSSIVASLRLDMAANDPT